MVDVIPIIGISIWLIVKIFAIFGLGIYVLFSLIVVRQVQLMTDTLEVGFESPIRLIALLHLIVSLGVFILALFIL